ncbi:MAG: hypothetical protein WC529_04360 [Candidatus Margulisiibacteriota bacterium]
MGKGKHDVAEKPAGWRRSVKSLCDGQEADAVFIKYLDQLIEILGRPGQPVDLVRDNDIDFALLNISEHMLQGRAIQISAGITLI